MKNQQKPPVFDIGDLVCKEPEGEGVILHILAEGKYEVGFFFDERICVCDEKDLGPVRLDAN